MLANHSNTLACFAIFKLIKFMCFGSTFSYPHKEKFLILRQPDTHNKFNPLPPRTKINPRPPQTRTHSSAVPAPSPQMRKPSTRAG